MAVLYLKPHYSEVGDRLDSIESSRKYVRVMYTPPEPHFYIAKLGYAGVYLYFSYFWPKHCGYSLEPPTASLRRF